MKFKFDSLLKYRNIKMEELLTELGINPEKTDFTYEEIEKIGFKLRIPTKNLLPSKLKYYSRVSFKKGIDNQEIDDIIYAILNGNVINVNDTIYFRLYQLRLYEKMSIPKDYANKLLKLLLINGEWDLANRLTSNGLYYKFTDINNDDVSKDILLKYLFANYDKEGVLLVSKIINNIYPELEEKSQLEVKDMIMKNYVNLKKIHDEALKNNMKVEYEKDAFLWFEADENNNEIYRLYYIDHAYELFDEENKNIAINLLNDLRKG